MNDTKYRVLMRMESGITLIVAPSHVSFDEASKQIDEVCSNMAKFPGGTQSVSIWAEPV